MKKIQYVLLICLAVAPLLSFSQSRRNEAVSYINCVLNAGKTASEYSVRFDCHHECILIITCPKDLQYEVDPDDINSIVIDNSTHRMTFTCNLDMQHDSKGNSRDDSQCFVIRHEKRVVSFSRYVSMPITTATNKCINPKHDLIQLLKATR